MRSVRQLKPGRFLAGDGMMSSMEYFAWIDKSSRRMSIMEYCGVDRRGPHVIFIH